MDWLTFIVEMTKALGWPLAAVIISLIFRKQIQALLARIRKGKLGPAEVEFEEGVRELQQELPAPTPQQPPATALPGVLRSVAEPRAAVLEAWVKVESALDHLARKSGHYNALSTPGSTQLARRLQNANVLKPEYASLFKDLRALRNEAAHSPDFAPSIESVVSYVRMAQDLESKLSEAANAL